MARAVRRTFAAFTDGLSVDDILRGTVVEPEGNDNYIVNLNGFNVMAYSKTKLVQGMKIRARVTALQPHVEIMVVPDDELRGRMQNIDRAV
jgi:hypothetical protein